MSVDDPVPARLPAISPPDGATPIPSNFLAMESGITILNYLINRLKIPVRKFTTNDPVTQDAPDRAGAFQGLLQSPLFSWAIAFCELASGCAGLRPACSLLSPRPLDSKRHSPSSDSSFSAPFYLKAALCRRTCGPEVHALAGHAPRSLSRQLRFLSLGLCASTSPLPSLLRMRPRQ
jgi:hypothetical protein